MIIDRSEKFLGEKYFSRICFYFCLFRDFDLLKVKVESAEEIAQRRVDEIYEKLEKRIEDLDRRALQCCSASSSPKPTPAFRLNHVMQLDEPVSVVAEKLNQIEQQMDFFDKETQRLKSDQKELQCKWLAAFDRERLLKRIPLMTCERRRGAICAALVWMYLSARRLFWWLLSRCNKFLRVTQGQFYLHPIPA